MSLNDYEGLHIVRWQSNSGWNAFVEHIESKRHVTIRRNTERELDEAIRDGALRVTDPAAWYATLGER